MVQKHWISALIVVSTLLPCLGYSDDLTPPIWRLGNPSATVQEWDFVAPGPTAPDGATWGSGGGGYVNPFGTPFFAPTAAAWLPVFAPPTAGPRTGVYELPPGVGELLFEVPNHGHPDGFKEIRVQVTWWAPGGAPPPVVPEVVVTAFGAPFFAPMAGIIPTTDGWFHSYYDVSLPFCPSIETITVSNPFSVPMYVDQVVIDTICHPVPEPGSLIAIGAGIAAFATRRRRKG